MDIIYKKDFPDQVERICLYYDDLNKSSRGKAIEDLRITDFNFDSKELARQAHLITLTIPEGDCWVLKSRWPSILSSSWITEVTPTYMINPKMSLGHLDYLSEKYLGTTQKYSYFAHLWQDFLKSLPKPPRVQEFIDEVVSLGYQWT